MSSISESLGLLFVARFAKLSGLEIIFGKTSSRALPIAPT
eukprot:SAG31_NODE_2165_length_6281_cov_2.028308_8_plen_39_part_01